MSAKKLGFGLMRLPALDPNDESKIDLELTKKMVDTFIERGFTYFDTAWMYCKFQSEHATKAALVDRYPRESYTLATKLHCAFAKTKEERDQVFEEQFRKTGVEYFDYYLMHALNAERYEFYKKTRDIKFEDIKVYKLNDLLNDMYFDTLNSIKFNDLDLKEIYLDSIASIETYDNNVIVKIFYNEENIISKKQYINLLATKLIEQGYQEIGSNYYKTRFKNEKYNITITYESGYIVIVGMEN